MSEYLEGLRFLAGMFGLSIVIGSGVVFGAVGMVKLLGLSLSVTVKGRLDNAP